LRSIRQFHHLGHARERLSSGRCEEARRELELARLARPDDEDLLTLCVSSWDPVAWRVDLLPSVVEIMTPEAANAPKLHFEGEGVVLSETPKMVRQR